VRQLRLGEETEEEIKEEERRKKPQDENIMACPIPCRAAIINQYKN